MIWPYGENIDVLRVCVRENQANMKKKKTVLASLNNKNNVGIAVKDTFFFRNKMFGVFFIYSSSQYCIIVNKP